MSSAAIWWSQLFLAGAVSLLFGIVWSLHRELADLRRKLDRVKDYAIGVDKHVSHLTSTAEPSKDEFPY